MLLPWCRRAGNARLRTALTDCLRTVGTLCNAAKVSHAFAETKKASIESPHPYLAGAKRTYEVGAALSFRYCCCQPR